MLMDDSGHIIEANDRAIQTYGYSLEELVRFEIRELLAPSELTTFTGCWNHLLADGSEVFEGRHKRKDGSTFPVEVSSRSVEIEDRWCRHSVIRDITVRKQDEEEIRRINRAVCVLSASNQAVIRAGDEAELIQDICAAVTGPGGYRLSGSASRRTTSTAPSAKSGRQGRTWNRRMRSKSPRETARSAGDPPENASVAVRSQ